jgi:uncharacterized membrane protein YdcZ (DUF606 family)
LSGRSFAAIVGFAPGTLYACRVLSFNSNQKENDMIFKSLTFWTLVAGLLAFLGKFIVPTFPLTADQILALIVSALGLVNVVPDLRVGVMVARVTSDNSTVDVLMRLLRSKPFWTLVAGLIGFVVRYYFPTFPLDDLTILGLIVFALGMFNITPELATRGLIQPVNRQG